MLCYTIHLPHIAWIIISMLSLCSELLILFCSVEQMKSTVGEIIKHRMSINL